MRLKKVAAAAILGLVVSLAIADGVLLYLIRGSGLHSFGFPGAQAIVGLAFGFVGFLVVNRTHSNLMGWLLLASGVISGMTAATEEYGIYSLVVSPGEVPAGTAINWVGTWVWSLGIPLIGSLVMLFPNGRFRTPLWRWPFAVFIISLSAAIPLLAIYTLDPTVYPPGGTMKGSFSSPVFAVFAAGFLVAMAITLASSIFLLFQLKRVSGIEKQQIKVFGVGGALLALGLTYGGVIGQFKTQTEIDQTLAVLGLLSFPTSIGIAVLRYRLYEVDLIINKALVYGALAAFVSAAYAGVVIGIGALVGAQSNLLLSIAATALVAMGFQPVRRRLQGWANVLVYGKRATPYEAMSDFSRKISGALSVEEVLPQVAEAAALGVGAAGIEVTLHVPNGFPLIVTWPKDASPPSFDRTIEITHLGEKVGEIAIKKRPGEAVTPVEEKLLVDLASQAGPALRNVRFAEELKASRRRLVAAQDEERRRMERDIHDGAQQQLVAMSVKLGLAENLLTRDPEKTSSLLVQLKGEASEAVETLRDLARGLFPQVLADKGLAHAVASHVEKMGIKGSVSNSSVPRLTQDVETAVYFVIREALQNASKHAAGSEIDIRLSYEGDQLVFEVTDRGPGFDPSTNGWGSGMQNMRDRIEALGGQFEVESEPGRGTRIAGRVPASTLESVV